ncbi:hypothetical protein FHS96_004969 [Sphingomonas zeicaulis]|uniref:hypothetical protein n=1 Tax=Sphingomonas zeicaulis TaxID=1632740 RepID=UPI003D19F989
MPKRTWFVESAPTVALADDGLVNVRLRDGRDVRMTSNTALEYARRLFAAVADAEDAEDDGPPPPPRRPHLQLVCGACPRGDH